MNSSRNATAPALEAVRSAIQSENRYPLALGTRWTYDVQDSLRFRANGAAEFGGWTSNRMRVMAEASRTTILEGQTYTVIDRLTYFLDLPFPEIPYRTRQYLRMDSSALYSYPDAGGIGAVEGRDMPAPGFHESVLLVYPARVGAHWKSSVRSDSDYDFEVEAIEPVRTLVGTFPAARVRGFLHSGQPGTEPERIWYGKPGVVRSREKRVDEAGLSNGQRGIRETITNAILTSFVPGSPQAFFVPTAQ